jgi:hypothetical protein
MKIQRRRIVVGDIHGELEGFREILTDAKLIDDKDNWVGDNAVLIQTGDVIDRGPYSREAIDLLRRLQKQSLASRGAVVRLCGNHELMLLQGDYRYANFNDPNSLAQELREEITKGAVWASYTDGERFYTHAGLRSVIRKLLLQELKAEFPTIDTYGVDLFVLSEHLNKILRESVEKNALDLHPVFHVAPDRGGRDPVGGIFWSDFTAICDSRGAWNIPQIFGHTPTGENKVKTARGLALIDVDGGMCAVHGGKRVYLEITSEGNVVQHSKPRSKWTVKLLGKSSLSNQHTATIGFQNISSGFPEIPTGETEEGSNPQEYMVKLKETFQSSFSLSIEPFLPEDNLVPLDGSEQEGLLFGSLVAMKEGAFLVQNDIGKFVCSCPEGYFLIGFWGHGLNSHAFYYVKSDANWKVFFRLPYGGVYMDNKKSALFIKDFMTNYLKFENKFKSKIASFTAVNSMGDNYYKITRTDGREYEVDGRMPGAPGQGDFNQIFDYPLIRQPESQERVKRLQVKLKEYKKRLDDGDDGNTKKKQQFIESTSYKIRLLETILLDGSAHTYRIWKKMGNEENLNPTAFHNACRVIDDYCRTGGKKVKGGTGF